MNNGGFNMRGSSKSNVDQYHTYLNSSSSRGSSSSGWWNSIGWIWQSVILVIVIVLLNLMGMD